MDYKVKRILEVSVLVFSIIILCSWMRVKGVPTEIQAMIWLYSIFNFLLFRIFGKD